MAVSKSLRYQILRRDNHTCRYCGATAANSPLTVDHVIPDALGGTDEPSNLVTACADCNSGKGATPPDAPTVDDVASDALRWSRAMEHAADIQTRQRDYVNALCDDFRQCWREAYGGEFDVSDGEYFFNTDPDRKYAFAVRDCATDKLWGAFDTVEEAYAWIDQRHDELAPPLPRDWQSSIRTWHTAGIRFDDLATAVAETAKKYIAWDNRFRYFCGIVWNQLRERQQIAQDIIALAEDAT